MKKIVSVIIVSLIFSVLSTVKSEGFRGAKFFDSQVESNVACDSLKRRGADTESINLNQKLQEAVSEYFMTHPNEKTVEVKIYNPQAEKESNELKPIDFQVELNVACGFLKSRGVNVDSVKLSIEPIKDISEYLIAKSDDGRVYVLVAKEKYHNFLSNPVLAYSLEGRLNTGIFKYLEVYRRQLNFLLENKLKERTVELKKYKPQAKGKSPLLGNTKWGQRAPFNNYCPKTERQSCMLAGCGPVALAQVMRYYAHPACGSGFHAYRTKEGDSITMNFSEYPFEWHKLKDKYGYRDTTEEVTDPIANLMFVAGVSSNANYGKESTYASVYDIRKGLVRFLDYSPKCSNYGRSKKILNDESFLQRQAYVDNLLGMTYRDLDENRPIIVSNDAHIFVCDGYEKDFLHFNLGWNGTSNGYYRLIVIPEMNDFQLLFNHIVTGIQPNQYLQDSLSCQKVIKVKKPGTLSELLSDDEKKNLQSLTLTGKIDGRDMKLIRRMAGAVDDNDYFSWRGSLSHLDLHHTTFVDGEEDGVYYLSENAKDINFWLWRTKTANFYGDIRVRYDFKSLTEKEWDEICFYGMNYNSDYHIDRVKDEYFVGYFMQKNKIGMNQFRGCVYLKTLILPSKTKKICKNAFRDCLSLQNLVLPTTIKEVDKSAFINTLIKR